jgi:GNAT superfamily N-acetyltransferase
MNDIQVITGTPNDVHDVMELALMGSAENGFAKPNPQKLLAEIWPALHLHYGIMGLIRGERLEGAILLRVSSLWYSDEPFLDERAIYVHPEFRSAKGGRAARLCEFAKTAAQKLGLPLMIGVLSNTRTAGKVRLYERQFGPQAGSYFLYNAPKTGTVVKYEASA